MNDKDKAINAYVFRAYLLELRAKLSKHNECGGCEAELIGKVIRALDDQLTCSVNETAFGKLQAEVEFWKARAEAAESDLHDVIKHADDGCRLCANRIECKEKECPKYAEGFGMIGPHTGEVYPNMKWSCMDFEYGTCDMLAGTACDGCDFQNHFKWIGPKKAEAPEKDGE